MKQPLLTAVAVCALGLAAACSSSDAPSRSPANVGTRATAPVAATGGYAFPNQDAPYQSVLAEARRTGKPALLFFWTSW